MKKICIRILKRSICVLFCIALMCENAFASLDNYIDATDHYGYTYLCINNNTTWDYTLNYQSQLVDWYVKDNSSQFKPEGTWRGFEGFEIGNRNNPDFKFPAEAGKNYVIRVKIKNTSANGITPYFGVSMNDSYDPNDVIYTNQYGKQGMKLIGNDWTEFKATITLPADYNSKQTSEASKIFMGMNTAMPRGTGYAVDCSQKDSVYIAEEEFAGVKLSCDAYNDLDAWDELDISGEIVNQIGIPFTDADNLKWYCLDKYDNIIDEAVINNTSNGIAVDISNVPYSKRGRMKILAYNISDGFSEVIYPETAETNRIIYVSPNGNDLSNGDYDHPLKTLSGARDRVRKIKNIGEPEKTEVVFLSGTYYFDDTVAFDNDDLSNGAEVIYRACDKNSVVFSGARRLDTNSAKKISDNSVYSRLDENIRDSVAEFDLSTVFPYNISNDKYDATISQLYRDFDYPLLYLDDIEQQIAQWPKGDSNYSFFTNYGSGTNASKDSIIYIDDEPSQWTSEKNAWVGGYLSYDYSYVRMPLLSVDTANKLLKLKIRENVGGLYIEDPLGITKTSKRWKAFNVLEEIKNPTEWYLNPDSMKLYYYIPTDADNKKLEISVMKSALISLSNTKNISFENITFEKTRGDAITASNVEDIKIKNCSFNNIGTMGISIYGTKYAQTDKDYWQRQYIDAAYDCEISDCIFNNIGGHGVLLDGGNVDTLALGNNIIRNCIFYRCSNKIRAYEAIMVKGCGNIVEHNNISNCPFQAIRHYGNNHKIQYNEIYDVIRDADDCGAIYCGRNTIQRGTRISYNYIHDLQGTYEATFGHKPAIYWDDNQTGITADHNIIKNAKKNIYTNGIDATFNYNTSVDITTTNLDIKNGGAASNNNSETTAFSGYIYDMTLYNNAYPNLSEIIAKEDRTDRTLALLTTIKGNLCVNGTGTNGIQNYTMYSKDPVKIAGYVIRDGVKNPNISNNIDSGSISDFIDPLKQDYRIKKSSSLFGSGLLDEDFDIEQIGVISETNINNEKPKLITPTNNSNISEEKIHFAWSEPLGANKYKLIISTDANFANTVKELDTYYGYADVELDNNGSVYYWKVIAYNTSREFDSIWKSDVNTFKNGCSVKLNYVKAEQNIYVTAINCNDKADKTVDLYAAMYDENGKLLRVYLYKNEKLTYNTERTICGFEPYNMAGASTMKVFVWDKNYTSLGKFLKIEL